MAQADEPENQAKSKSADVPLWLADLLFPVYEKMRQAQGAHEAAVRQAKTAKERFDFHQSQFGSLLLMAETQNLTRDDVERFCREMLERKMHEASLPPEAFGMRRVSNNELMLIIGRSIRRAGRPLDIEEILTAIESEKVYLPGKEPRKNLLAYISRSPLIITVKRGLYGYDPELLAVAEKEASGTLQGDST